MAPHKSTTSAMLRRAARRRHMALTWPSRQATTRRLALSLAIIVAVSVQQASAQFLFTYEINSESDDSRAPKSSLFDPSSFKIVTPAQLQSAYSRLADVGRPAEQPNSVLAHQQPPASIEQSQQQQPQPQPRQQEAASSFLKQTSAALHSFAELFHLSPASSPAPSPAALGPTTQAAAPLVDQQAEARSLHEHWTQQHQRAQQQSGQMHGALNSFAASSSAAASTQSPPIASAQPTHHHHHHQQQPPPPAASYWLTANPLSPPDGNYLVEVPKQTLQQRDNRQAADDLLSGNNSNNHNHNGQPSNGAATQATTSHSISASQRPSVTDSAQDSFLSATPSSYYSAGSGSPTPPNHFAPSQLGQSQPLHSHQARSLLGRKQQQDEHKAPRVAGGDTSHEQLSSNDEQAQQLQPPANTPEHFGLSVANLRPTPATSAPLKSAEESLIAFRQAQHQQLEQENALNAAQQHLEAQREHERAQMHTTNDGPVALGAPQSDDRARFVSSAPVAVPESGAHKQHSQQTNAPNQLRQHPSLGEIPKVSPQIYESFLLQQKDQFEKHMELLKQQQELNKLLEQKHRQQEQSAKQQQELQRRRKKDELERGEARKRLAAKQQQEHKLKLELKQQAAEQRRREQDEQEAEERRKALAEQEEARRFREQVAAEQREREQKELAAKRAREQAERERLEKERREQQESKLKEYLRQKEELRKLLELKQKEDELAALRRQQAATNDAAARQGSSRSMGNIAQRLQASRLALEHRERAGTIQQGARTAAAASAASAGWGAPIRASRSRQEASSELAPPAVQTGSTPAPPASSTLSADGATGSTGSRTRAQQATRTNESRRQQKAATDEKLIRQKIPLYSGAGKYGLYRGSLANDSTLAELAALLDSVTLPSLSTSTTTAKLGTTQAPASELSNDSAASFTTTPSSLTSSISFDDDVPRRPVVRRTAVLQRAAPTSTTSNPVQNEKAAAVTVARPVPISMARANSSSRGSHTAANIGLASLPADLDNDGIPGRAGLEYPVLSEVPRTSFSCSKQPLNGYYADTETACQVVHLCQGGVQSSILCPNGTIFNQEKFSCQWWYEVNCSRAPIFYQLNDNLYKALPDRNSATKRRDNDDTDTESSSSGAIRIKLKRTSRTESNNL